MALFSETVSASQKASFEAAANFADSYLGVVERLTQLNIDATRTAFEKSAEMLVFFWEEGHLQGGVPGWNAALHSSMEQFSAYCQGVRAITQEVAKAKA